jgi:hypothetical protein
MISPPDLKSAARIYYSPDRDGGRPWVPPSVLFIAQQADEIMSGREYGCHKPSCRMTQQSLASCSCGLEAAIENRRL